ncbi:MAG: hypothetical protein V1783_07315, partial [Bacteroidota bacterium]
MVSLFKKILKAIIWLAISLLLMFIILVVLIQIPAIQNKLTHYAISFISNKTHTRVDLKKISISFPKSVVIDGLFLEDIKKDTLLYAGEAKVNIAFRDLFNHKIHISSFALEGVNLNLNRKETDSLFNYDFLLTAFSDTTKQTNVLPKTPSKWTFSLDNVSMKGIRIHYDDEYGGMNAALDLKHLKLKMDHVDLAKSIYSIDELLIESLTATVLIKKQAQSIVTGINLLKLKDADIDLQSDLAVKIKRIDLEDNSLFYKVLSKPELKNTFDAGNLNFKHITLAATDIYYSSVKTGASVKKFTAVDQNNFSITEFQTDFSMDQHSITAKKLKATTTNSSIDADIKLQYSSLKSLTDSLQSVILNADMRRISIRNSDITYFSPQLTRQAFFKDGMTLTTISGSINGTLNNLNGKNLIIETGANTLLKSDFIITGLPDIETTHFNFPNLKIKSGRKDIERMAGLLIPKTIELPEKISMQVRFKGQVKDFESTVDMGSSYGSAHIFAAIDRSENFSSKVSLTNFDFGSLLKNKKMYGPVTLTAETDGKGFDTKTIKAKIKADVSQIYLNNYTYHNLNIDGNITGQKFEGKINLNDENAVFDFDGLVNLNPNQEQYVFRLNVPGVDLEKLNFTKDDIRISLTAVANLKGGQVQVLNGKAGITNIIIAHEGKKYVLDSLLFASINEPNKSDINLSSALIGIKYTGTVSPTDLPGALSQFLNNYFPFSDAGPIKKKSGLSAFNFEIQLHNHPIISEVLFPQLKEFDPGIIQGSFDEAKNELKLNATIKKMVYGTTVIKDLEVNVNSDVNSLNYKISSLNISNAQIKLENFLFEGKLADKTIIANISSIDQKQNKKLLIRSQIKKSGANYRVMLDPKDFYLMNNRWDIAADNYIEFGKQGFLIHHLFMNKTESQINMASVHDQFNDDLSIDIKNFKLDDISRIIEKDTSLVKGNVDGNVLLKRVNNTYGIIADAKISNLFVRDIPIGNLTMKAGNPTAGKFD